MFVEQPLALSGSANYGDVISVVGMKVDFKFLFVKSARIRSVRNRGEYCYEIYEIIL